jgi:hypothetical protein
MYAFYWAGLDRLFDEIFRTSLRANHLCLFGVFIEYKHVRTDLLAAATSNTFFLVNINSATHGNLL